LAEHVAVAPHRLDEVAALRGIRGLLAQLADEDVDDLQLRLVMPLGVANRNTEQAVSGFSVGRAALRLAFVRRRGYVELYIGGNFGRTSDHVAGNAGA